MRRATALIKRLRLNEISLVDEGDNPHADVLITKARDPADRALAIIKAVREDAETGGLNMDLEARLAEIEKTITTIEKERDDALAEVTVQKARADKAEAAAAERDAEIVKLKGGSGGGTDEDIFKGLSPELRDRFTAIEKRALASEAALAEEGLRRETDTAIEKARGLGFGDPKEIGGLLVRVEKGKTTAEDRAKLEGILGQVATIAKKGDNLFRAVGSSTSADGDEEAILKGKAQEIQKAKPGLTYEQAYAEALDANPELYNVIAKRLRAA